MGVVAPVVIHHALAQRRATLRALFILFVKSREGGSNNPSMNYDTRHDHTRLVDGRQLDAGPFQAVRQELRHLDGQPVSEFRILVA